MNDESNKNISNEPQPDVLHVRAHDGEGPVKNIYDTPEMMSRRRFLNSLTYALGGLGAVAVILPVGAYIVGPLFTEIPEVWRAVGTVDKFKVGDTTQVSFEDASPVTWAGVTAQTSAWLRRDSDQSFTCFAVNCTHLGCPVSWVPGGSIFMCPCHGGVYYQDGSVAAGPPPQSLFRYDTRIKNGQVEIKATGAPIPTE
ncbi:MAG TPA: Rieske 2Fe-2S domain-containing protein [Chloroflexia bacterium]|nr:Rieske 2Fe-2S domain-containing protein [Chloroflexia bacterium]